MGPLAACHPDVGALCPLCECPIDAGEEITLVPTRRVEGMLYEAELTHYKCARVLARWAAAQPVRGARGGGDVGRG